MNEMIEREQERSLATYYGWEAQSRQCIEEMSELTKAINKHWRYSMGYLPDSTITAEELKYHIVEEMADVQICINQMLYMLNSENFKANEIFGDMKTLKLNRSIKRIQGSVE